MQLLNLIRYKNLILLAVIQLLMDKVVVMPILQTFGFQTTFWQENGIYLLIIATVFIAAGGYVVNDYFDFKIDAINKPESQIVGKTLEKKQAMTIHQILSGIGIVAGLLLSVIVQSFTMGFIFIVVPGLLWFYSASYKRQFLVGNLVTSLICGLSILIVAIMHVAIMVKDFSSLIMATPIPSFVYTWVGGFAFFAFMMTWVREIIKDMEDEIGDREMECRTMPILWGQKKSKLVIYILMALIVAILVFLNQVATGFTDSITLNYILFGITLPLIMVAYLIFKAKTSTDYHQASTYCKYIMLVGVMYCFVFYFNLAKFYNIPLFDSFIVK